MTSILLSGPAGANKSALARQILQDNPGLMVAADFQSIYAALVLAVRGPDGRFPLREEALLPLVEYVRRAIITAATARDIDVVATNSDGDPARRKLLLNALGLGAIERIVDPGRDTVVARLQDPITNELSPQCGRAIDRWYGRL